MTSGFHMLREIKLILKISRISHMSGFYLLEGGQGEVPPNLSAPPQKKSFSWKKIKSHFKYWLFFFSLTDYDYIWRRYQGISD